MYLASIKADNFRVFESTYVELNKGLNLLIGENDAGKTSLIDAIRLALDTNSAEWVRIKNTDFSSGTSTLSIQLKFYDLSASDGGAFAEHLSFEEDSSGQRGTILYVNLRASLGDGVGRNGQAIRTEIRSGSNCDGPILERDVRLYLSTTYLKPLRDAENELSAGRMSRLSQLLASPNSVGGNLADMERLIELIIQANQSIKADPSISQTKDAVQSLLKLVTFKGNVFSPVIDMLGSKNLDQMTTGEKNTVFRAIVERLSLGLNEAGLSHGLGYSNLLFMAAELMLLTDAEDGFPLLLIEEPEAHLHPQLQMKFIKYLAEQQPNLQCILSTHSPNLASKVPLENLIIMSKGQAFPLRKGCTALDNGDYPFLEKFLDVSKANMFFAKGVLLVEGDGENILLPTIAELLGRPLEDYGVSIVNVGNLAYKRYAKIYRTSLVRSSVLPIKVACITDLDIWPDKAEKKDGNVVGFKEKKQPNRETRKKGNLNRWFSYYDDKPDDLATWKSNKCAQDGGNVKTFISDEWTFEYCLAKYGLASEVFQSIKPEGAVIGFNDLPYSAEERAIKIYSMIETRSSGKTESTYHLAQILRDKYKGKSDEFRGKLPPYIVSAIEHVTETFNPVGVSAIDPVVGSEIS
ncbi:ATP-dependent nuclease [Alkalimarinus alittae]|uniref:AAA family ATPase n=1 Tax=Alkalimarinus alittae TaxID=2961619 RepID=A0ABY6N690_9ALTE|nr:AAA family ATPase [Alkalimarinus alittae]UZE97640.1 AAA family ATPase [Alkalimarinus alittae]